MSGAGLADGPYSMAAGAAAALAFLSQESRVRVGGVGGLRVPGPVTMDSFFFGIRERRGGKWCWAVRGRDEEQEWLVAQRVHGRRGMFPCGR